MQMTFFRVNLTHIIELRPYYTKILFTNSAIRLLAKIESCNKIAHFLVLPDMGANNLLYTIPVSKRCQIEMCIILSYLLLLLLFSFLVSEINFH